mmetsp:Transcript_77242/g.113115  ORF Transcript_77242/g.113115 Transcript_77242/m.113115 type:complete len:215 (-) Transcript_77242:657-1301(-)
MGKRGNTPHQRLDRAHSTALPRRAAWPRRTPNAARPRDAILTVLARIAESSGLALNACRPLVVALVDNLIQKISFGRHAHRVHLVLGGSNHGAEIGEIGFLVLDMLLCFVQLFYQHFHVLGIPRHHLLNMILKPHVHFSVTHFILDAQHGHGQLVVSAACLLALCVPACQCLRRKLCAGVGIVCALERCSTIGARGRCQIGPLGLGQSPLASAR